MISLFNKEIEEIQFSFTIQEQVWEACPKLQSIFKGNMIEANVTMSDIRRFILVNINEETFLPFLQNINTLQRVMDDERDYEMEDLWEDIDDEEIIDVILGIRKDVKMYSQSVVKYLYEFLQEHKDIKYSTLLDALKRAAKRELEDSDAEYPDRLISFTKLRQELESV